MNPDTLKLEDNQATRPAAILIAGPTASGKSALALALAGRLGGAVVNADSMQVYADLAILNARPSAADEARVPHHLYGHIDAAENYSVGRWLADIAPLLETMALERRLPIIVGGTGLYFRALTQGLSDIPHVPDAVRATIRAEAEGESAASLHARLQQIDTVSAARLRPSDRQRVLRALEVQAATGQSLTDFQGARQKPLLDAGACRCIFLAPERAELHARIEARFHAMMVAGALDEIARLKARNLDPALPAMRAHGVPHLIAHLNDEMTREEAIARSIIDTRHYVKRQFTFARHQLPAFAWTQAEDALTLLQHSQRSPHETL